MCEFVCSQAFLGFLFCCVFDRCFLVDPPAVRFLKEFVEKCAGHKHESSFLREAA